MAKSAEKKEVKKSEPAAEPRQSKAIARYMRIAPRKLRRVIQSVRRKPVYKAMEILGTLPQKGARLAGKVLKSAIANAKVQGLDANCLIVKEFRADCAPSFKRFLPRSMGRADRIIKRTSHISVVLVESAGRYTSKQEEKALAAAESTEKKTAVAAGSERPAKSKAKASKK